MKYLLFLLLPLLVSCVSSKHSSNLQIDVVDRDGKTYTDYIVKVSNEKGEFIYSHVVNNGAINKVSLNGIQPGLYRITAICTKTSIEGEKIINFTGKRMFEQVQIPNNQHWLKHTDPIVDDRKGSDRN